MVSKTQNDKVDVHFFVTPEEAEHLRLSAWKAQLHRTQYIRRALGFDKPEPPAKKEKGTT